MNKLHKQRIQKWVDALKSGEYKQCRLRLKFPDGPNTRYCCLGVACQVYKEHTKKKIDWSASGMPAKVSKWFGLDQIPLNYEDIHNPYLLKNTKAIQANDSKGWSFKKIANAIEKTYLKGKS